VIHTHQHSILHDRSVGRIGSQVITSVQFRKQLSFPQPESRTIPVAGFVRLLSHALIVGYEGGP
jgi:hypothetical protein